jgi:sulfiredoxin
MEKSCARFKIGAVQRIENIAGSGLASFGSIMMKRETIPIADIYVPIKSRATLEQKRVDEIATSMLDKGQQAPILVRADGARFVLVEGLCRGAHHSMG